MRSLLAMQVSLVLSVGCAVDAQAPSAMPGGEGKMDDRDGVIINLDASKTKHTVPVACSEWVSCNFDFRAQSKDDLVGLVVTLPPGSKDGRTLQPLPTTMYLETVADRWCNPVGTKEFGWIVDPKNPPVSGVDCGRFETAIGHDDQAAQFSLEFSLLPSDADGAARVELYWEVW